MLESEKYYHIYNRANGTESLFVNEGNYHFFLQKYKKYIDPVAYTFCYCLMPNHFHFFIQMKTLADIIKTFEKAESLQPNPSFSKVLKLGKGEDDLERFFSKQFSNLFSSYTQAFNKQQERSGSLFQKNFKRKEVKHLRYFQDLVKYIHCNPVHHGFCDSHEDWVHSSYHGLISKAETSLDRKTVIEWFGNEENVVTCHKEKSNTINSLILE